MDIRNMTQDSKLKTTAASAVAEEVSDFRARIVAVTCGKGGVGKSSVAVSLCAGLALSDEGQNSDGRNRVILCDIDVQRASTSWIDAAAEPGKRLPIDVLSMASAGRSLPIQLEPLARIYDWIVIDCPPNLSDEGTVAAILCSDLVLTPVRACPPDLRAVGDTISMVRKAREVTNPGLLHRILINQDKNTAVANSVKNVLASCGTPILESRLGDRTAFQRAAAIGSVPALMGASCRTAAEEIARMTEELKALFEGDLHEAR